MKKLLALLLVLFILTLTGCNAAENTSSDIDTNSSEIVSSTDESSSTETSSDEAGSGTSSEESSSQTSTPSKTESSSPSTTPSNKTETSSNNISSNIESSSSPSDCVANTTPYKTVTLYEKTTYYGIVGYFDNTQGSGNNILLEELGLGSNSNRAKGITEYYNVVDGSPIWFVFNNEQGISRIMAEKVEEEAGKDRFSIPANVVNVSSNSNNSGNNSSQNSNETSSTTKPAYPTIVLNQKTTYYGYSGYFLLSSNMNMDEVKAQLINFEIIQDGDLFATCCTEFYCVDTNDVILFAFNANKTSTSEIFDFVDNNGGRGQIPVKIILQ